MAHYIVWHRKYSENVHKLSYELRSIWKFESWHLDQIWALCDFPKFMTEMEKWDLLIIYERVFL